MFILQHLSYHIAFLHVAHCPFKYQSIAMQTSKYLIEYILDININNLKLKVTKAMSNIELRNVSASQQ